MIATSARHLPLGAADPVMQEIKRWNSHIHAFVDLCTSAPISNDPPPGLLSGLTIGVKDVIDVAGLPTRNGSDACYNNKSAIHDARVVATLRHAGARIVGKTATTEFAFTDPTDCRNPHDLNRSPGGSSSGSGAAVAAGVVDIALGTQTAGSLCRPAAYCGAVGFKPTYGVLSSVGVTPLAPSFDSVGVIAGSVDFARKAFDALAPSHATTPSVMDPKIITGLWETDVAINEDTSMALHEASKTCAGLGIHVTIRPLIADVEPIVVAHRSVMHHEAARCHGDMLIDARIHQLKPKFRAALQAGATVSTKDAATATDFLTTARRDFWQRLAHVDMVLTLPVPDGAPLIDGTTGFQDWITPWTVFGGPLVCLPWGIDRLGRPRSVMLAAHPGQDAALLVMAARLERHSPPLPRPQVPDT